MTARRRRIPCSLPPALGVCSAVGSSAQQAYSIPPLLEQILGDLPLEDDTLDENKD